ncbi:hypothetical protein LIER_37330 [Lithospermum erythrorhizon]|uniref:Uncharacterized protein n=1 Tax=Lithospermum erythrorhizon TaxID=34254 RepID=A0AAV3PIU6_LITER
MCMHVPPTSDDSGKNPNPGSIFAERVASTETLISPAGEGVQPSVKDTSVETSYKSAKTHSSADPTVDEFWLG